MTNEEVSDFLIKTLNAICGLRCDSESGHWRECKRCKYYQSTNIALKAIEKQIEQESRLDDDRK